MRRVVSTVEDSVAVHHAVVAEKHGARRARLTAVDAPVAARIDHLVVNGPFDFPRDDLGHSCVAGHHAPCLRKDLEHCWKSPTATLNALKLRLTDELGYFPCLYCGIGEADTFDHYLPQRLFPEFSATAINLIPCCNRCNVLKRTHVARTSKRILHPVLDPLDQRFLECTIVVSAGGVPAPNFRVDETAAAVLGILPACKFHFKRLDLSNRLRRVTAPRLSEFLNTLESMGVAIGPVGAVVARDLAGGVGNGAMPNKWDVLLYGAIADWMDGL